jgi:hypothetical protein
MKMHRQVTHLKNAAWPGAGRRSQRLRQNHGIESAVEFRSFSSPLLFDFHAIGESIGESPVTPRLAAAAEPPPPPPPAAAAAAAAANL